MDLQALNEMRRIAGLPLLTEAPLSRTDVDGNIQRLLQDIEQLAGQVIEASKKNIEAPAYGVHDKWGIQGNLVHIRQLLNEALEFITN